MAVLLWVPSTAVGVWWVATNPAGEPTPTVAHAPEATPNDARKGISVTRTEHALALNVMRANLVLLHQILEAVRDNDRAAVTRLATEAARLPGPARRSPSLRKKLPPQWRELGQQVDAGYQQLADAASTPDGSLMEPLTLATGACVSCHAIYRLDLEP